MYPGSYEHINYVTLYFRIICGSHLMTFVENRELIPCGGPHGQPGQDTCGCVFEVPNTSAPQWISKWQNIFGTFQIECEKFWTF